MEAPRDTENSSLRSRFRVVDPARRPFFPVRCHDLFGMYKDAGSVFWTVEEIDLQKDIKDWEALNPHERKYLSHILAFFSVGDELVNENLFARFRQEVPLIEAKAFYDFQIAVERVHSEMYSLLIDTYVRDSTERDALFDAAYTVPTIKQKGDWVDKWMNSNQPFPVRLIAFALVEGVFFSGSFASIYWFKEKCVLPGLTLSNEYISRDEGLHVKFACLLYTNYLRDRVEVGQVYEIVREAVKIEQEFFNEALSNDLVGLRKEDMQRYIEYVADFTLGLLGYPRLYNAKIPEALRFMENLSIRGRDSPQERRTVNYTSSPVYRTRGDEGDFARVDEF